MRADISPREKKRKKREAWQREEEKSGCTYRRVVCSVYKESCLFLADGYRRKTICLGDLECFVSPPPSPRPSASLPPSPPSFYRRSSPTLAPLPFFASLPPVRPLSDAISRRVIHDANKTSFLPIVHRPIRYRGPIRQMDTERGIDRSWPRELHLNQRRDEKESDREKERQRDRKRERESTKSREEGF